MTLHLDSHSHSLINSIYGIEVINALNATLEKVNITANLNFKTIGDYALAHVSTTHEVILSEIGEVGEILHSFKAKTLTPQLAIWLQCHQNDKRQKIIECLFKTWQDEKNMFFGTTDIQKELKILELL